MTEREFDTIISKLDNLDRDNQLLAERLELYRQTGEAQIRSIEGQIQSVRAEIQASNRQVEAFQEANKQQIEAMNRQIEAFQEANKQQLNVSLGVLVTAAITIVASVVVGMQ